MDSARSLAIRLKRHSDGSASLTLTRTDGTVTWQRQKRSLALVFPSHDLTHYAVEQTLGYGHAFFGLVAGGWDVSDFATPWRRGPIPAEAREVEMIVGLLDGIRRDQEGWNAAEFNAQLQQLATDSRFANGLEPRTLSDDDLARVRAARNALLGRWAATARGEAMEMRFELLAVRRQSGASV